MNTRNITAGATNNGDKSATFMATTASMGDRAKALAANILAAGKLATSKKGKAFLFGNADGAVRHEPELVVAAVSFLNFTDYKASAARPGFLHKRKKSEALTDGALEWVIKVSK